MLYLMIALWRRLSCSLPKEHNKNISYYGTDSLTNMPFFRMTTDTLAVRLIDGSENAALYLIFGLRGQ